MSDIQNILLEFSRKFNKDLAACFPLSQGAEKRVIDAMKYSVMNGGKRLRPYLLCACAELFGVEYETAFPAAASIEMLHSYSLIHDDLPAMDNDDLRRGKPTCHKQFDEATAILAGDGLLTYAFGFLADSLIIKPEVRLTLIQLLADASGAFGGMVSGQTLDIYASETGNKADDEAIISRLEEMKTGRLLRYACEAGAVLGMASLEERNIIISYARKIGQAFQIADDILDREGNQEIVGKTLHKDDTQSKFTFVSYYGIGKAREKAKNLVDSAVNEIGYFKEKSENLQKLARYIIDRDH